MGRIFETEDKSRRFEVVSNWLQIREMAVTHRHSLWDFSDHGVDCGSLDRHPVSYFKFGGRMYAIGEFVRLNSPYVGADNIRLYDVRTKSVFELCACNMEYGNPLYLRLDDGGEYIRLYREVD